MEYASVIWPMLERLKLAAEDPTVVAAGFGELTAQLGIRDVVDMRDPVASVQGVLAVFSLKGC